MTCRSCLRNLHLNRFRWTYDFLIRNGKFTWVKTHRYNTYKLCENNKKYK